MEKIIQTDSEINLLKKGNNSCFSKSAALFFVHRHDYTLLVTNKNIAFISEQVCHQMDYSFFLTYLPPAWPSYAPSTNLSELLRFIEERKHQHMMIKRKGTTTNHKNKRTNEKTNKRTRKQSSESPKEDCIQLSVLVGGCLITKGSCTTFPLNQLNCV